MPMRPSMAFRGFRFTTRATLRSAATPARPSRPQAQTRAPAAGAATSLSAASILLRRRRSARSGFMVDRRRIVEQWRERRAHVLVTLVRAEGSSYRRPGAHLLIGEDGAYTGTIS